MNEAAIRLHIEKLADGRFLATSVDVSRSGGRRAQHRRSRRDRPRTRSQDRRVVHRARRPRCPPALTDLIGPYASIDLRGPSAFRRVGRLAGFRYREVARRLRRLRYRSTGPGPEATKSGVTSGPAARLPCRAMPETWRREPSVPSFVRRASTSVVSSPRSSMFRGTTTREHRVRRIRPSMSSTLIPGIGWQAADRPPGCGAPTFPPRRRPFACPAAVSAPGASLRGLRNPLAQRLDRSPWQCAQGCWRRRGSR